MQSYLVRPELKCAFSSRACVKFEEYCSGPDVLLESSVLNTVCG